MIHTHGMLLISVLQTAQVLTPLLTIPYLRRLTKGTQNSRMALPQPSQNMLTSLLNHLLSIVAHLLPVTQEERRMLVPVLPTAYVYILQLTIP